MGLLVVVVAWAGAGAARGQDAPPASPDAKVAVNTAWSADGVEPGGQVLLAVVMRIAEGWHVQEHEPQWKGAVATTLDVGDLPTGVVFGDMQWPESHLTKVEFAEEPIGFYTGTAPIFIRVSVPPGLEPGQYPVELSLKWQACDDRVCLRPQTTKLTPMLNVVPTGTAVAAMNAELFAAYKGGTPGAGAGVAGPKKLAIPLFGWDFEIDPGNLWLLLPIAAIGGFLLNLTPCVLPMVPIKIMGLSRAAANRTRCFLLGAVMAAGVVAFWMGLGITIATVSGFTSTNQLFQYPWFTVGVGIVIAVMALGMGGMFAVRLPQWVYSIQPRHDTLAGSFGFGIMTAVLSTPCTAPLMGAAAAWAATQSGALTLATFAAIGMGMAMPYLVLSAFPKLVDHVPRTGPASELIKQVMGLLLLAAAAYFIGTGLAGMLVDPPDPPTKLYWWAVALFIAAAGAWLAWRTIGIARRATNRAGFVTLGAALIAVGVFIGLRFTDDGPIDWIYYTPERLAAAQAEKKVVVLEFTAEWCLNCHALEQAVLHNERVVELLGRKEVAAIKVDLTGNNEPGNAKLLDAGRRTIPLLVVYSPGGEEVFKSDAYTVQQVVDAIERAAAGPQAAK